MKKVLNYILILLALIICTLGGYFFLQKDKYYQDIESVVVLQSVDNVQKTAAKLLEEIKIAEEEKLEAIRLTTLKLETEGKYELPLKNSMGISVASIELKENPDNSSKTLQMLNTGETFLIQEEKDEEWLYVELSNEVKGYIPMLKVFINLPDIIPSIQYNIVNSEASIFQSSGYPLENITGLKKYETSHYNERLDKEEYVVPIMYPMAEKIQKAQTAALADGNTLVIYESYRPYSLQKEVVTALQSLMQVNEEVKAGISTSPWSIGWFISTNVSNHQRASAIDVTLAKVNTTTLVKMGDIEYNNITQFTEYTMQTPMHELSIKSTSLTSPVASLDEESWKNVGTNKAMTDGSILLRKYCDEAGLTPIASEWWHFNDVETIIKVKETGVNYAKSIIFDQCISSK